MNGRFQRASIWLILICTGCSGTQILNATSPDGSYTLESGIAYGEHPRQKLDIYTTLAPLPNAPTLVFFYGGGWRDGNRSEYAFVASALTARGFSVVIADYRLYPDVVFPVFVEDGADALNWLAAEGRRYGLRSDRISLIGHSAGAHIAALLALDQSYRDGRMFPVIESWVGMSGPYDFLPIEEGYLLDVFPEATRTQSQPVNFVRRGAPSTLLLHGADDDIVDVRNSERLAVALAELGNDVRVEVYPDAGHARPVAAFAPLLTFLDTSLADTIDFLLSAPPGE
ncbi:MAG: alpha/beta hydrolase [Pseudomonadota bacterium]